MVGEQLQAQSSQSSLPGQLVEQLKQWAYQLCTNRQLHCPELTPALSLFTSCS